MKILTVVKVCVFFRDAVRYEGLWKTLLVRDFREAKEAYDVAPRTLREYYCVKLGQVRKGRTRGKQEYSLGLTLFKT